MDKKVLYDLLNKAKADSKKSLNKEEQKKYRTVLLELLKEEGLNDETIFCITSGVKFKSANTFSIWCSGLKNEEQLTAYEELMKSRAFNILDNPAKLRFALTTIANLISEKNVNQIIVGDLFHSIVDYSLKKDGNRLNDVSKIFQNNFMNELKYGAKLPVIAEFHFTPEYTIALMELLTQAIEGISPKGDDEITRRNTLREWLKKNAVTNSDVSLDRNVNSGQEKIADSKKKVSSDGGNQNLVTEEEKKIEIKGSIAKKIYEFAVKVDAYEQNIQNFSDELKQKEKEIAKCKTQIEKTEELYRASSTENRELRSKLEQATEMISELQIRKKELQDRVNRQSSVIDIIDEDKDRSLIEFKNQIASALKKIYNEFVVAQTMDMTVELGLNMRDSLDDVFRKLKKQGIDIEGR